MEAEELFKLKFGKLKDSFDAVAKKYDFYDMVEFAEEYAKVKQTGPSKRVLESELEGPERFKHQGGPDLTGKWERHNWENRKSTPPNWIEKWLSNPRKWFK